MSRARDRGASAVEFALVAPLLLLLVFGVIDFGRLLNAQITITEAAREGARAATIDTANPVNAAKARVLSASDELDGTVSIQSGSTYCSPTSQAGSDAKIITQYDYKWITPVGDLAGLFTPSHSFGAGVTLTGTGVMPCHA